MSSSPESIDRFLWTSASNSSESSEMSLGNVKENGHVETQKQKKPDHGPNDSEDGCSSNRKDSKKKKSRKLSVNSEDDSSSDRKHSKKKRRKLSVNSEDELKRELKAERVSDCDTAAKPKRERDADDDSFLELKVKQERRHRTSTADHSHTDDSHVESTHIDVKQNLDKKFSESDNTEEHVNKKKKKKKDKKKPINIEDDLFSASETVIQSPPRKQSKSRNDSAISRTSVSSNTTVVSKNQRTPRMSTASCDYESEHETAATKKTPVQNNTASVDADSSSSRRKHKSTEGSTTRKLRLSERITFEDEEEESPQLERKKTKQDKKQKTVDTTKDNLVDKYTSSEKLRNIEVDVPKFTITEDDDVWLVNSPREVTASDLSTRELTVDGKGKIKIDGNTYDCSTERDQTHLNLNMCSDGQFIISRIALKGTLQLRKRIPKPHVAQEGGTVNKHQFIPLPETKLRHPLLGAEYRAALALPPQVARRLRRASDSRHATATLQPDEPTDCTDSAAPATATATKKRKRKRSSVADAVAERADSPPPPRKKSKKAKRNVDAGTWDSAQAIEENLFNF